MLDLQQILTLRKAAYDRAVVAALENNPDVLVSPVGYYHREVEIYDQIILGSPS